MRGENEILDVPNGNVFTISANNQKKSCLLVQKPNKPIIPLYASESILYAKKAIRGIEISNPRLRVKRPAYALREVQINSYMPGI